MTIRGAALGAFLLSAVAAGPAGAVDFKILHSFTGYDFTSGHDDGSNPAAGVIVDEVGNIYGTTSGTSDVPGSIVFWIKPDGKIRTLYAFGQSINELTYAPLVRRKGYLYGTLYLGGTMSRGAIFRLTKKGARTDLYSFNATTTGCDPQAGLVYDKQGNLYGTDTHCGTNTVHGYGAVFKLSTDGKATALYDFVGVPDGGVSMAPLLRDKRGNLYGTTSIGGHDSRGTIFKIAADGTFSVLHHFENQDVHHDGASPHGGVVADAAGNLYGATSDAGVDDVGHAAYGTVYKLTPAGVYTVLHAFKGGSEGRNPQGELLIDRSGNLYGATNYGGGTCSSDSRGCGTIFKVAPNGTMTILHAFNGTDGAVPVGSLATDASEYLYGTTNLGGAKNKGVVFKVARK